MSKGHNKRSYPNKGTSFPQQPPVKKPRGRPRKEPVDQPVQPVQPVPPSHLIATAEPSRIERGGRVINRGGSRGASSSGATRGKGKPRNYGGRGGDPTSTVGMESSRGRGNDRGGRGSRGRRGRGRGRGKGPQISVGYGMFMTQDSSYVHESAATKEGSVVTRSFSYNFN
ncbi:uncharacterized protein LOC110732811 [Chenopodium quinoa]|uniref:uncharacterized protein LOC110732811 n=1 Tax=Chenopodium quinoa TaxID=63459 RepID=UPI000B772A16|nr:uncharacterized protein LOC110732811 [Chenopodium quinoa]